MERGEVFLSFLNFYGEGGKALSIARRCPICSEQNGCQIEDREVACWCTTYHFPESLYAEIEKLPTRCICESCAKKLGARKKVIHKK